MYLPHQITKEGNQILRLKAKPISLPLKKSDLEIAKGLMEYLEASYNEELIKKYKIQPGVGIAAPQVGKSIRMFGVNFYHEEKNYKYLFINPKIIKKSEEMIYLPGGEGCLSVERKTEGLLTPRHEEITIESFILDMESLKTYKRTLTFKGYPSIVFQHEYDHLEGVLYVDKLYKEEEILAKPAF